MKKCKSCKRTMIKTIYWAKDKCIDKEICVNPFCKKYENVSSFNIK